MDSIIDVRTTRPFNKAAQPGVSTQRAWLLSAGECLVALALTFNLFDGTHARAQQPLYDQSGNLVSISTSSQGTPRILVQPRGRVGTPGGLASFSVTAVGAPPLFYQWQFNNADITGATNDSLLLTNLSGADFGPYRVIVSNALGTTNSASASLDLDADGDGLPDNWEISYFGSIASQNGAGDRDKDGISNLAEYQDGSNPTNANSYLPRLTFRAFQGSVTAVPDLERYTNGQSVTLSATPDVGLSFISWTGSTVTNTNTITIVMNSNKTLLATCGLPLGQAIDVTNRVIIAGDAAWFGQTNETFDGVSAARSGAIGHNQKSSMQLSNAMSAEGTVSFWWKVSSQYSGDFLSLFINNVQLPIKISGDSNWLQRTFYLTSGVSVLRWEYAKNASDGAASDGIDLWSTSSGDRDWYTGYYVNAEDAGFIDQVRFNVYNNPLLDTDANGLPDLFEYKFFYTLGIDPNADPDGDGTTNAEEASDGTNPTSSASVMPRVRISIEGNGSAARQPDLAKYQSGRYVTNTATAGSGWSFVAWAGTVGSFLSFGVATNNPFPLYLDTTKTLTAIFGLPLAEATDTPGLTWTRGGNLGWYGQTNVSHDGVSAARSGVIGPATGESWMETSVQGPASLSFWWKVDSTTNSEQLTFLINSNVQPAKISGVVDWQPQAYYLGAGTNILRWRMTRASPHDTNRMDAAWVDQIVVQPGDTAPTILQSPTSRTVLQTSNVTFSALAVGTPPMNYEWFVNGTSYAAASTNRSLTISNIGPAHAGTWFVRASNSGGSIDSAPFTLAVLPVPPGNDDFANSQPITVLNSPWATYNFGATKQPGEPDHAGSPGGRSVWFSWTAPQTGKYLAVAEDTNATSTLLLAVYRGSSVDALTEVASASDYPTYANGAYVARPTIGFNAPAGVRYSFAVDTSYGVGTWFTLAIKLIPPPPNDNFANRIPIHGPSITVFADNRAATREPGEPSTGFLDGSNSVWWAWTAPRTGTAQATAQDSSFYAFVSIFTGNVLASLSPVGDNMFLHGQAVQFPATQGTAYQISVDDIYGSGGDVVLNVAMLAPSLSVVIDSASGQPVFNIAAAADLEYVIQTSIDLINWSDVSTNQVPQSGLLTLSGLISTNPLAAFYRAVLPQN